MSAMRMQLAALLARQLARSWRIQVIGGEEWDAVESSGAPYLLLCWHEALLPVMWHHRGRGIAAVISEAMDGEYLTRFAASLGYGTIRGSSTRGGRRAYAGAVRSLADGIPVGITPDGPRGPRRVAKAGAVLAAARTGALIVPVHADAQPGWRARSWDRFLVPAPFAKVRVAYGRPFRADGIGSRTAVAQAARELNAAARGAAWPTDAAPPTA